jgi:hypothetical protein
MIKLSHLPRMISEGGKGVNTDEVGALIYWKEQIS